MKRKILGLLIIVFIVPMVACQKNEGEKKEVPKKGPAGYIINFKPNDNLDLVPAKTLILQQAPMEEKNLFYLDVVAKAIGQVSGVTLELSFNPADIQYVSYKPGIGEQQGKAIYTVGPKGDQKGKLEVKISFEGGSWTASSTGKLVTLCFKVLQAGRSDILFENGQALDKEKKKVADVNWVGGLLWVLDAEQSTHK